MILIFSIAVFVTALLAAFVFHSALMPCLIAAGIALALGIGEFLLFRKKPKMRVLGTLACIALAAVSACIPAASTAFGTGDYEKMLGDYASLILEEKYDKAVPAREKIEEKYGMNDDIRYIEGMAAAARKDVNKAEEYADGFADKTALQYFALREEVCNLRYPDLGDCREALRKVYTDAVACRPNWSYAEKQLGILLFHDKEYDRARYWLTSAADDKEKPDGEILYYLGASFIEQGDNAKGLQLLGEAYELDVDEHIREGILWYADKAGLEGEA